MAVALSSFFWFFFFFLKDCELRIVILKVPLVGAEGT